MKLDDLTCYSPGKDEQPIVVLSWFEILSAAQTGSLRNVSALKKNHKKFFPDNQHWQHDIEGACAEMAVAKHLGMYWDHSVIGLSRPDVGPIHVRHTQCETGHLIIRPHDDVSKVYVLVIGSNGRYRIVGWIVGENAAVPRWRRNDDPPAWWIPQSSLLPINKLRT